MKLLSWNCWRHGGTSTIAQLKESSKLYLPDVAFLCETKQATAFVEKTVKKLNFKDKWLMNEPDFRKVGILITWSSKQVWNNDFYMELKLQCEGETTEVWVIFVYGSTNFTERQAQWEFLKAMRPLWG